MPKTKAPAVQSTVAEESEVKRGCPYEGCEWTGKNGAYKGHQAAKHRMESFIHFPLVEQTFLVKRVMVDFLYHCPMPGCTKTGATDTVIRNHAKFCEGKTVADPAASNALAALAEANKAPELIKVAPFANSFPSKSGIDKVLAGHSAESILALFQPPKNDSEYKTYVQGFVDTLKHANSAIACAPRHMQKLLKKSDNEHDTSRLVLISDSSFANYATIIRKLATFLYNLASTEPFKELALVPEGNFENVASFICHVSAKPVVDDGSTSFLLFFAAALFLDKDNNGAFKLAKDVSYHLARLVFTMRICSFDHLLEKGGLEVS